MVQELEEWGSDLDQIQFGSGPQVMGRHYPLGAVRREVEERKAEIRRELVLRVACGGPDFLEQEEELRDELAALEHGSGEEPGPDASGGASSANGKMIREVSRWR